MTGTNLSTRLHELADSIEVGRSPEFDQMRSRQAQRRRRWRLSIVGFAMATGLVSAALYVALAEDASHPDRVTKAQDTEPTDSGTDGQSTEPTPSATEAPQPSWACKKPTPFYVNGMTPFATLEEAGEEFATGPGETFLESQSPEPGIAELLILNAGGFIRMEVALMQGGEGWVVSGIKRCPEASG